MARVPIRAYLGDQQLSRDAVRSSDYYERPSDWLVLPPAPEPQGIRGLVAVFPEGSHFAFNIAGSCTMTIGTSSFNVAGNTNHTFTLNWNDADPSTFCSGGYRQQIITIVPQAGQNLTNNQFALKPNIANLSNNYSSPWLDMNINLPNISNTTTGLTLGNTTSIKRYLERIHIETFGILGNLSDLFRFCPNLQSLNEHEWDTRRIVTLLRTFRDTRMKYLDTSNWVLTAVTTMESAFINCKAVLHGVENWDLRNVTTLNSIFFNCGGFNIQNEDKVLNLNNWKISDKCTNLGGAFQGTRGYTEILCNTWNVSSATATSQTFYDSDVTTINLSGWDLRNCSNCRDMFYACTRLNNIVLPLLPLSSASTLFETSSGSSLGFFAQCNNLQSLTFSNSGINSSISFNQDLLGASQLNYIFNNLSLSGTNKFVRVTANPGISQLGYNPSIATNKGWTIIQ